MKKPRLEDMSATTRALHDAVNANAPWLHPERRTIQRDLVDSTNVVAWQEAKARFIALGDGAWSELPHLYARYGTPGTTVGHKPRPARVFSTSAISWPRRAACRG